MSAERAPLAPCAALQPTPNNKSCSDRLLNAPAAYNFQNECMPPLIESGQRSTATAKYRSWYAVVPYQSTTLARTDERDFSRQPSLIELMSTRHGRRHVSSALFASFSAQSLLRFSRTCQDARAMVTEYIKDTFSVHTTLVRFFPDPSGFRSLQARTGTLISGSVALQFFDRAFYPTSDLDLYVHSKHRREVGLWLLSMGYTFTPSRGQDSHFDTAVLSPYQRKGLHYVMPGVLAIFTFHRRVFNKSLKAQIIVACRAPMEVVLGFHSSKSARELSACSVAD